MNIQMTDANGKFSLRAYDEKPGAIPGDYKAQVSKTIEVKLKGTVVKWEVTNPHSWIYMDVKGDDGKAVTWMIEGGSPNNLYRLGFTKDSLPPGAEIMVEGYQAKDRSTRAVGKNVTFSDGRKLFLGLQARESDPDAKK